MDTKSINKILKRLPLFNGLSTFIVLSIFIFSCTQNDIQNASSGSITQDSINIVQSFSKSKTNEDSSAIYLKVAETIAQKSLKNEAIYLGVLSKEIFMQGQLAAADSIADKGLSLNYESEWIGLKGKFYNIKGNVAGLKKNIYESIDLYLQAEKIYESTHDSAALAGIYSNIANCDFSLKNYPSANQYATKAYSLLSSVKEANIASNIIITYALSLNKVGKNKEALPFVRKADSLSNATQNKVGKIVATIGFAEVYKSSRKFDSAAFYYQKCTALSQELGIKHFELMSQIGLMSLYEEQGKITDILRLAEPAIELAKEQQNTDVLHTAKRIAGKAFAKEGQYQKGFQLLTESYTLYDSVAGVENQKNINELLVKYDAEKNEKAILNQNLLIAKQEAKLRSRQIIILGLVLGLALVFILYFYFRKLNKERFLRFEIEKQLKIGDAYISGEQKERTRLAFEIHDGIASELTGITYKLRSNNANTNEIIELLTGLHENTRRISHRLMPIDFEQKTLAEAVQNLCDKNSTKEVEVVFFSNMQKEQLEINNSLLLYRIIQELINNALKYAACKSIFVRLENKGDHKIEICVEDDGIGIDENEVGKGFASIKERIKSLGASLLIESEKNEGTTVKINYSNE